MTSQGDAGVGQDEAGGDPGGDSGLGELRAWFEEHYGGLHAYARRWLRDGDRADDVIQQVFVRLWRRRGFVVRENIKAYLYRATRNAVLNELRGSARYGRQLRRAGFETEAAVTQEAKGEDPFGDADGYDRVRQAIESLPRRCREAFELHCWHGLTCIEAGAVMGVSAGTVKVQVGRALKRLRRMLLRGSRRG